VPQRPDLEHLVPVPTGTSRLPAVDVEGWDLAGTRRTVRVASPGRWTLLLFLGSHCDGCAPFWKLPGRAEECGLGPNDAVIVVTRGPKDEQPEALATITGTAALADRPARAPGGLVMSDGAWAAYRVHGAPFFVLLDGVSVVSEGVAWSVGQVSADVARARLRAAGEAGKGPRARR
jgi:hypothetical protein